MKAQYATLFDFFDLGQKPQAPKRIRKRRAKRASHVALTRWPGKGYLTQVRWSLTRNESVNAGLYDSELAAVVRDRLAREALKHPQTPLGIWQALQCVFAEFREQGVEVPRVLPKFVKQCPAGGYFAKVKKGGRVLECPGPYPDPVQAHEAMLAMIANEFAPGRSVQPTLFDVADEPETVTVA